MGKLVGGEAARRVRRRRKRHDPAAPPGSVRVECVRAPRAVPLSARTARVAFQFGLALDAGARRIFGPLDVPLGAGRIVLVTGSSGAGKSSVLAGIAAQLAAARHVAAVAFEPDQALLDGIEPVEPVAEALALLTACGLGAAPLWLRAFDELSEGEKFRARLARAIALHLARGTTLAPLIVDEFCSGLHRRGAQAIAYNLRKLATRRGLCIVAATSRDDLLADLRPDTCVRLDGRGGGVVEARCVHAAALSFHRRLRIEPGHRADYETLAATHYRSGDEPGFVDKVFVLREGTAGEVLGAVVYAHGPIELALRNTATGGIFVRNAARLNRELRILRRLVIHPDVRGCGLGHELVRRTLPRVGTPYVECLAAMGAVNPVFERAGMQRIGVCAAPKSQTMALEQLRQRGIDPLTREFADTVARSRAVRGIVGRAVAAWYRATTAEGAARVSRQSPQLLARLFRGLIGSRPVYYLWKRDG